MPEIALNILDIAENSVRAGASLIEITVSVQPEEDKLTVVIKDDGCGMTPEETEKVLDPFYTTRTTRKVGLGVPFFRQAAESTGGSFRIVSEKEKGLLSRQYSLCHILTGCRWAASALPSIRWSFSMRGSTSDIHTASGRKALCWIPAVYGRCLEKGSHFLNPRSRLL